MAGPVGGTRPTIAILLTLMSVGMVLVLISNETVPGTTILESEEAPQPLMKMQEQTSQVQQLLSMLAKQASSSSAASSSAEPLQRSATQAGELKHAMSQEAKRRDEMLQWRVLSQKLASSHSREVSRSRHTAPVRTAPVRRTAVQTRRQQQRVVDTSTSPELEAISHAGAMLASMHGAENFQRGHQDDGGAARSNSGHHTAAQRAELKMAIRDETKQRLKTADMASERDQAEHALKTQKTALEAEKNAHEEEHKRYIRMKAKLALTKQQDAAELQRVKKQARDAVLSVQKHALQATKAAVATVKRRAVQLASTAAHDEAKQLITAVSAPVASTLLSETSIKTGVTAATNHPPVLHHDAAEVMQSAAQAKAIRIAKQALKRAKLAEVGQAKTEQRLQLALQKEAALEAELKQQKTDAQQLVAHAQHIRETLRADFQRQSAQAKAPEQQRLEAQVEKLKMERDMANQKIRAIQVQAAGGKIPPVKDPRLTAAQKAVIAAKQAMARAGAMANTVQSRASAAKAEAMEALSAQ